jgi:predicted DNA-binding transcriptional regulator AlpA
VSLATVSSLDELAADPGKAAALPPEAARALTLRCLIVLAALATAAAPSNGPCSPEAPAEDRLLDVEEAARRLAVSPDWLYRRATRLPFTVRPGRTLRFSARGLERYLRQRQGR